MEPLLTALLAHDCRLIFAQDHKRSWLASAEYEGAYLCHSFPTLLEAMRNLLLDLDSRPKFTSAPPTLTLEDLDLGFNSIVFGAGSVP